MANKNTLRLRRAMESSRKTGKAERTENGGKWQGDSIPNQEKVVAEIRHKTREIYWQSA